jgi:tetratricopeptide (TPR) repeat protein
MAVTGFARVAFRCLVGARWGFLAVGLLALPINGAPPAIAQTQSHPWQMALDAAVDAELADDSVTAEVLANAALEVALKVDEKGPRPNLTRLVLQLIYVNLGSPEKARQVAVPRMDVSTFDRSLLPVARTFDRLGNNYFERFRALADTEQNRKKRTMHLELAERAMLLKWAIQNKLLPEADLAAAVPGGNMQIALAATISSQALVYQQQGKLAELIERYEAAVKIWNDLEERDKQLTVGSQFSLSADRVISTSGTNSVEDPTTTKFLLARAYIWRAQRHLEEKKSEEAAVDFQRAETIFREFTHSMDQHWPTHPYTASGYLWLGRLYSYQNRYSAAEDAYRKSLAIFDGQRGPRSEDSRMTATEFAQVLRKDDKESEAAAIEARYGVKGS